MVGNLNTLSSERTLYENRLQLTIVSSYRDELVMVYISHTQNINCQIISCSTCNNKNLYTYTKANRTKINSRVLMKWLDLIDA